MRVATLTPREHGILELLRGGRSRTEAAAALGISRGGLNAYVASAYGKLGIRSLRELLRIPLPAPHDRRRERSRRFAPGTRRGDVASCRTCGRDFVRWQSVTDERHGLYCSNRCAAAARASRIVRGAR